MTTKADHNGYNTSTEIIHIPVLCDQLIQTIRQSDTVFVDGTLGHGGHIIAVAQSLGGQRAASSTFIGVDKDPDMLTKAQHTISQHAFPGTWIFDHRPYDTLHQLLDTQSLQADRIILDIGVNREHFADPTRGFSCKQDGPLDMRFNTQEHFTARDRLMKTNAFNISLAMQQYGDLSRRFSDHLGRTIVDLRHKYDRHTTRQFTDFLHSQMEIGRRVIAIIFQVIRIQVNDELIHLDNILQQCIDMLAPGGRCAIISYHSGEDRRVKHAFKQFALDKRAIIHTKKPMMPTPQEVTKNPAASSAKCRIIEKI